MERLVQGFCGRRRLVRQGKPASRPPEQRDAEILLETADLMADRSRRDIQLARSLGEAAKSCGRLERPEGIQRRQ